MAKIIRRVEGEYVKEFMSGIQCAACGCGWTNRTEAQPCENCGATMKPYRHDLSRYVAGYIVIECACGAELECSRFTDECNRCGRLYNWAGQELAPREQWGKETGEHWADVARIA
jgi:hypothetical protein